MKIFYLLWWFASVVWRLFRVWQRMMVQLVQNKFMSCPFDSDVQYSADVLALFDITMTYTVMDGTVKEAKTDKDCKFYVKDKYTKLPVAVKYEVKAVKKQPMRSTRQVRRCLISILRLQVLKQIGLLKMAKPLSVILARPFLMRRASSR